jgi:hypothetical protein
MQKSSAGIYHLVARGIGHASECHTEMQQIDALLRRLVAGGLKKYALLILLPATILLACAASCHSLLTADESSAISDQTGSSSNHTAAHNITSKSDAGNPADTSPSSSSTPQIIMQVPQNNENYYPLCRDGDTQYYWRVIGYSSVLYSMNDHEAIERQLAVFAWRNEHSSSYLYADSITQFGICGDWIIASVGFRAGTANLFDGYTVRMKKDGSEYERLDLGHTDQFIIVGDLIFYNYSTIAIDPEKVYGCYRMRPDGTDVQYMGDSISSVLLYADD